MKNVFLATVVLGLLLFGCASQSQPTASQATVQATAQTGQTASTGGVKEISMTAQTWEFTPSTITVNKGDRVKLMIKSLDTKHGFALPDFNVQQDLNPGDNAVEFTADKAGTFDFRCFNFCGSGHSGMAGKLIVNG